MKRRQLLPLLLAGTARGTLAQPAHGIARDLPITFPRDHGAHLAARTEWWYATGWLGRPEAPTHGVQVTFFRSRTGLAEALDSRFAARHLLFAHAAVTDLAGRRHHHAQRIQRWNGRPHAGPGHASLQDLDVTLGDWRLWHDPAAPVGRMQARVGGEFAIELQLQADQPALLQGEAGYSQKGPDPAQASLYYSRPQLAAAGHLQLPGQGRVAVDGRAWLDHEWSDEILHPDAVGWDWLGINLFDGGALTAFRLRRSDGSALWAGGSHRSGAGERRNFAADSVRFSAGRRWTSPSSAAVYPMVWQIETPAGRFELRALMDAQELDSRASTGTLYWEGLSELLDSGGHRVGLGYLEMTGYAGRLRLA